MVDSANWWANRLGRTAAATTSAVQRQPNYGVAFDLATAPLNDLQREQAVNAVRTQTEVEAARAEALRWLGGFMQNLTSSVTGEPRKRSFWERAKGVVASALSPIGDAANWVQESAKSQQGSIIGEEANERHNERVDQALTILDEKVLDPAERAAATPFQARNIATERGEGFLEAFDVWLDGSTWEEAWHRADNSTVGQAFADRLLDPELRADAYEAGFDDMGVPLDANYREVREASLAYNLSSGTADFLKTWFADPGVVAAKGATFTRAMVKGDFDRMSRQQSATVQRIVSAPDSALPKIQAEIKPWNIVSQRALALREQMGSLRDEVRAGSLDANGLIETTQAFKENPAAAHLFYKLSTARKWDEVNLRYTDEWDDDILYHGVGAILGSPAAYSKLRVAFGDQGRGIAEMVDNLENTRLPQLDEELRLAEVRYEDALTDPNLTGFQAYERALNAQRDMTSLRHEADMVHAQLEEYEDYGRFVSNVGTYVSNSTMNLVPRAGTGVQDVIEGITSHTYRSPGMGKAVTYTKYPTAALRNRPSAVDLHREIHTPTSRFFDQILAHGREGVDWLETNQGAGAFNKLRNDYLNRAAAATTDAERRRIMGDLETRGFELVARSEGFTSEQARAIAAVYKFRRHRVTQDIVRQHEETKAYNAGGVRNEEGKLVYQWTENGVAQFEELPLTLTQLQQTFHLADLKLIRQMLKQHKSSIQALAAGKNFAADFASYFEAWWKPAVLFRGGYVIRNLGDEGLRSLAALNSLASLLDAGKAGLIGVGNMPIRAVNRMTGVYNRAQRRKWEKRLEADEKVVEGTADALRVDQRRRRAIEKNVFPVERWRQDVARHAANGVDAPKAPAFVTKLRAAAEAAEGGDFAFDPATGRRMRTTTSVVPVGESMTLQALDETAVARWVDDNAGLLAHPDGVVLVKPTDGGFSLSVGRRGAKYKSKLDLIPQVGSTGPRWIRSLSGDRHEVTAAFQQGIGDIYRAANSSGISHRSLTTSYERDLATSRALAASARRSVIGDVDHAENWLKTINDQLRPSPEIRARLNGMEISDWLKTKEGKEHGRRLPFRSADPDRWQDEIDNHLATLLPTERLRAVVRNDEALTAEDLQEIIDSRREVAPKAIDSIPLDLTLGKGLGEFLNRTKDRIYKGLATVPTDTLVRNPFFNRMYKHRLQRGLDSLPAGEVVSRETQIVMERQAREYALRQTRRYMFNVMDQTDLTHSMRFLSSFMAAWQETLQRWGRIIVERPEQFVRIYVNGWQNLDALPGVEFVDSNGLGKHDEGHGELTNIRIPGLGKSMEILEKIIPGDQEFLREAGGIFSTWNINKNGLNSVIQGEPWWLPGSSPFIQVPAAYMLRDYPHLANDGAFTSFIYKYLFPAGVPDAPLLDTIFPAAWMQQTRRLLGGVENPDFNRMVVTRVYQQEYNDWVAAGRPEGQEPDPVKVVEKAEAAQAFFIAARFLSPSGFNPEVKGQLWIDLANRIQTEYGYGEEGYQKFLELAGEDMYIWWQSTSQSHTGVPPTSAGFLGQKKYREQIEKYPELGLALVGLDAETDEFNYSVYGWQGNNPISKSDPRTQREPRGGPGTVAAAEEREGWRRWQYWNTKIDAELSARGLYSTSQTGAQDLAILKTQIANQLQQELPGWAEAYNVVNLDGKYGLVRAIQALVDKDEAPDRIDWHGMEEYLEIHRKVGAELDVRKLAGGSRDITATSNADLRYAYEVLVGELKQRNLKFADLYDRLLSNHQLTRGSGGV